MWTGEARLVRAEIAKHVTKITLTAEARTYIASGAWDLLRGVAVRMVPGARIELATPAFSGRRSTNELPRHRCLEIVGVMRSCVNSAKKQVVGQPDQELGGATNHPGESLLWNRRTHQHARIIGK
jgi:hypothetical protein